MILQIYSIYDVKAETYNTPFFMPNEAMALRAFKDAIQDKNHEFSRNPEDYSLFHLGSFDTVSSTVKPLKASKSIRQGLEFVRKDS